MLNPTQDVLQAVVNLSRSNPDSWNMFMLWLNASWRGHMIHSVRTENDVRSRWMQGRCQELGDLLQFLTNAEEELKRKAEEVKPEAAPVPEANKFD